MKRILLALLCFATPSFAAPAPQKLPSTTQTEIERLLRHPQIQSGHIGLAIQAIGEAKNAAQFPAKDYDDGKTPMLFAVDAGKRFVPASNMKLFTAGWVLNQLGAKKTFRTKVFAARLQFLKEGVWPKDTPEPFVLTLVGDGDPSLASADLEKLAADVTELIKAPLIVRAQNSVVGDQMNAETGGHRYPDGWTLDDALWYYGAPVTGLTVNRNQVDIKVKGAAKAGDAPIIESVPPAPFQILNLVNTVAKGETNLQVDRGDKFSPLGDLLTISGQIAVGQSSSDGYAVPDPKEWARQIFIAALQKNGAKIVDPKVPYAVTEQSEIASHESPDVAFLLQKFLKTSDNLYGELLLRRAGSEVGAATKKNVTGVVSTGLANVAHSAMNAWLKDSASMRFSDGSGLSRYDMVTPRNVVSLLSQMQHEKDGAAFYSALPVAGVDGTLKNRMKNTAAQNNVRAKTGTFSIVNCLSGYVTTRDGQRLAVSILTNGVEGSETAREWQGRVFATLANASWKTD